MNFWSENDPPTPPLGFFSKKKLILGVPYIPNPAAGPDGAYVVDIVGPGKMGLEYKYRVGG